MKYPRFIVAAPHSGSGKTTITCGILGALKAGGDKLCSFKCGPDYIDPMFHRNVIGIPAGNLDTFFTDHETTRWLFTHNYSGDIAVLEGVMGLYDGIGGVEQQGSTYDLAKALKAPVVLVVDAKGAGRSVIALIKGFVDYDKYNLIKAVILNRTSKAFGDTLGKLIEEEIGIKYLGTVPTLKNTELSSRHLGLVTPEEVQGLQEKLDEISNLIGENIDLQELKNIASSAEELSEIDEKNIDDFFKKQPEKISKLRLAVARDKAFCFYYRENLEMLKTAGVELVEFSPVSDSHLPENISGLLLGGGYPENYLSELQDNQTMKQDIKEALENRMPVLAECGGFMYLCNAIKNQDGQSFEMVGAIDSVAEWKGKLVRFGYVTIEDESLSIKGHEFHYFDTDNNGDSCTARKPVGDKSWECIHKTGASYIGFPHLYYPSNPDFLINFVEAMKKYGGN